MQPLDPLTLNCRGVRLIEASAGTGKTFTIATLYLRLLLEEGRSVREILVVTFTEAATEELRDRIRSRLREMLNLLRGDGCTDPLLQTLAARIEDPAAAIERLTHELTCIDEASIFTIHGFCQRMLQENAFESGALFDSEFLTDESELLTEVVEDYWRRTFYPDPGLAALAADTWGSPSTLLAAIRDAVGKRELRIRPQLAPQHYSAEAYRTALAEVRAQWESDQEAILERLNSANMLSRGPYKADKVAAAAEALTASLAEGLDDFQLPAGIELFTEQCLAANVTAARKKKGIGPPEHPLFAACQSLVDVCDRKRQQLFMAATGYCREQLARRKRQRGVLSFDDLLDNLADALQGEGGAALAERIAGRFPFALIDEFQDTDPQQYRIFHTVYGDRPETGLLMIGDPKQAIYSFRGADVFTYMAAKSATHPERDRFTLDTNWRSASALVQGVNTLFAAAPAPFVYAGHIDFHPVQAAGKADEAPLLIEGQAPVPLRAWFVPRSEENVDSRSKQVDLGKPIKKGWAKERLSAACAEEIVDLLTRAAAGQVRIGSEALEPRDIAVLVRDRFEAESVRNALAARGVPSVYFSRDSVFETLEAAELLHILNALAAPDDESLLRAALCTGLLGGTAAGLDALSRDELAWEALQEELHGYRQRWVERGFMAAFRHLLHGRAIPRRLLEQPEGERRLTNLLQLAELTQGASREHHGVENLLRWFSEQCAAPNGNSEEQQMRLESDADRVKIVTIHKSKGLEYPVVFLPFLWASRPVDEKQPPLFHDETSAQREQVLDLDRDPAHYPLAEKERLAEELRLAYVALTRARHLCYFAWGLFKEAAGSALAWLFHADAGEEVAQLAARVSGLDDETLRGRLEELAREAAGCLQVGDLPLTTDRRYRAAMPERGALAARGAIRPLRQQWQVASFTGLTLNRFDSVERADYGSAREDTPVAGRPEGPSIFQFPKGARAGTFMHHLFESIDFPTARGEVLQAAVNSQLLRNGYDTGWLEVMSGMVSEVLDTPLDGEALTLRSVTRERRLIELEFHYPLAQLTAEALNGVLPGLGDGVEVPRLRFNPVAGMMRGFIDLVFEQQGRFYLADYKSSYLGGRIEDYVPAALARTVAAHRYDLQYLIYTVALHRYLRHRMANYDYETHFGGCYYLFLRGIRQAHGPAYGVYFDRPDRALVERLDALFGGEREG